MKISIFTPTHDPKYLGALYESIKDQDFYEWVIVPNGGAVVPDFNDPRVKVFPSSSTTGFVGELKRFATSKCTGEILLEVDHDDLLTADATAEVKAAFENPDIGFVYSNHTEFRGDFEANKPYAAKFGWKYRPFIYNEKPLLEYIAFDPSPASVSRIWYAPNHLRAWRTSVYEAIGGHKADMRVLDDQDLMARTYLETKFVHIDKCLYLYRVDGGNTWLKHNDEIQNNVIRLYDENIFNLACVWAKNKKLRLVDLGGAFNGDWRLECADLSRGVNLNKKFPYKDNSVGVIRANDILEHLTDKIHVIKEIYRVLAPGGYLFVTVPSALSQGGFQDPTHVSYYVENSFRYYTEERFAKYIHTPVRFQAMRLYTTAVNADGVSWVVAHMIALKGQHVPGIVSI